MRSFDISARNRTRWLRAFGQAASVLGVIMIGLVWASLSFHLRVERDAAERAAIQNSTNLARAFGGHLSRSLSDIDRSLKIMRRSYMLYPDGFDFRDWIHGSLLSDDQLVQLSIIGPDGFLKLSSIESQSRSRIDLRDREHFRAHLDAKNDDLFIGKPVIGRASGKWSVQLARRIENADGSFGGVLVASVDPNYFARLYGTVDIGSNGSISIVGTDGIVRVAGGGGSEPLGMDLSGAPLFEHYPKNPEGWFYTGSDLGDRIPRLLAYRAIKDYPLIITIGVSTNDAFAGIDAKRRAYYSVGTVLTALILVVTLVGMRGHMELQRMSDELRTQNLRFDVALRNMSQGLCVFDAGKRLAVCNDRYAKMYQLPLELQQVGAPHNAIIAHRVSHGLLKGERDDGAVQQKLSALSQLPIDIRSSRIDELTDGRLIRVIREPLEGGGWVATHEDITEQKRAEWELDRARRFLDTIIEKIPIPIVVKEPDTLKFILVNQAYEAFIGIPRDKLIGTTALALFSKSNADLIAKYDIEAVQSNERQITADLMLETAGNGFRMCTTTRLVVRDGNGKPQYLIVIIEDVTERRRAESQIAYMAHHDPLTGLMNRARFGERLEDALTQVRRGGQVAVLLLDLDHFKHINDTAGHLIGDEVLKTVAERLRGCIRESDTVARLSGDEFAIIQTAIEQPTDISALADRIQTVIKTPYDIAGLHAAVDVSIGISLAPNDATDATDLMKQADMALYKSKTDGRGTYRFFEAEMDARLKARRKLEADLRHAIVNNEFELLYQPVVNLRDDDIIGLEALLRWHHPGRGLILPAEFVAVAEETGLIIPLGEWVLRQACSDAANWPNEMRIAVNLSPVQFRSQNLVQTIISALAESGVAPCRLELELTEAALLSHDRDNLAVLDQLRKRGVRIVMDDFGTGYSSLNYLRTFPFDKIKIDRSFVSDLSDGNDVSLAIVGAVVTLARILNVPTVAEGVETKAQLELIRAAGCTEFQGYLFSPPRPLQEIDELLASRAKRVVSAA
jgi:diguanylate cyclase (GGDEF)-like protein/PAS domain S-box-containing protein